jgi:hypothetical protein
MRKCPRFGLVSLGLCFLGMASCIDSENPLSDPQKAKPAADLAGVWRVEEKDGTTYYHVGLAGDKFPSGLMRMAIIEHKKNGLVDINENAFFLFTTALGDRHFVNVTVLDGEQLKEAEKTGWKPEMAKGYWIWEYRLKADKISLLCMDQEQKKSLIENKKLQGFVNKDKKGIFDEVTIQESSEDLAKFIVSPDAAKLFQPAAGKELERVK